MAESASHRQRLAWFSALNLPGRRSASLSAYATDQILPFLKDSFDITVFHNGFEQYQDFKTAHFLSASELHEQQAFDIFFYQLEDHPDLNFIRQFCGIMPGAIWFHDFLFTSHGPEPILNSPFEDTIQIFNSGKYTFRKRGYEYQERERSGIREAGLSVLQFFSREIARSEAQRRVTRRLDCKSDAPRNYYLPLPIPEIPLASPGQQRVCFCGSVQIEHRAHKLLQAISELEMSIPLVWLIDQRERKQAEELLQEFEIQNVELITGRSPEKWVEIVQGGGVAVHCLFSVYGQMGPYHAISMAAGLPTLVSDFAGAEFLPDNLVIKIEPGAHEARQIAEALGAVFSSRMQFSAKAIAEYARELYSAKFIAGELSFALKSSAGVFREFSQRWQKLEQAARAELLAFSLETNLGRVDRELFGEALPAIQKLQEVYQELGWIS